MSLATPSNEASSIGRLARSPAAQDGTVAAVAFALTLVMLAGAHSSTRALDPLAGLLAALACGPLVARRRAPLGVFALCTAASATLDGLGYGLGPPFGPTIALFYLAADQRTRDRLRQTGSVVVGMGAIHVGAAAAAEYPSFPTIPILGAVIVWGGAWIIGDQLRQRRQRLSDLQERARQTEREMARERQLAVAQERNRIARDLHDSAAHAINVILVQAAGARLLQDRNPAAVRAALSTIEDVARETIAEIDRLIGGLRDGAGACANGASAGPIDPPAGLSSAATLAERHRAAGLDVELQLQGAPRPLPAGVDQAAYRILQESLTNAARHGTGQAEVRITYRPQELELTISNPTALTGQDESTDRGYGILGMRERAQLLGGSLHAGRHGARFHVHARLPAAAGEPARR